MNALLVTGAAGFIGSNFSRTWLESPSAPPLIVLDALTYAGNRESLAPLEKTGRLTFIHGDICNSELVDHILRTYRPYSVVHFAAESHVDRSIDSPETFLMTNVVGTFRLLASIRRYYEILSSEEQGRFRFLHVSTDEVFGSLGATGLFSEHTPYSPRSPYSASKASSDHFVRAFYHTYGIPTVVTNCSNNYGPYQFPEKLIPLMILNCLEGKPLPVYGDGQNIRDWLYVEDHCAALRCVLQFGKPGEDYCIGGNCEKTNIEIVKTICAAVNTLRPELAHVPCESLITYVKDRPGHDRRYAISTEKITRELGWHPCVSFQEGILQTVRWYLEHEQWCEHISSGVYQRERLGQL